ncbi:unnamed protein product [Sympodiomycopsis kandeliae]
MAVVIPPPRSSKRPTSRPNSGPRRESASPHDFVKEPPAQAPSGEPLDDLLDKIPDDTASQQAKQSKNRTSTSASMAGDMRGVQGDALPVAPDAKNSSPAAFLAPSANAHNNSIVNQSGNKSHDTQSASKGQANGNEEHGKSQGSKQDGKSQEGSIFVDHGGESLDEWEKARQGAFDDIRFRNAQRRRRIGQFVEERKQRHHEKHKRDKFEQGQRKSDDGTDTDHDTADTTHDEEMATLEEEEQEILAEELGQGHDHPWSALERSTSANSAQGSLHMTDEDDFEAADPEEGESDEEMAALQDQEGQSSKHEEIRKLQHDYPNKTHLPDFDPDTMLKALQDEFGEIQPHAGHDKAQESIVSLSSAVLVRTVYIRGSLMLTNHRLAFVALLPTAGQHKSSHKQGEAEEDNAAANARKSAEEIIRQGPAIVHFPGWKRRRHAWFELRSDSLIAYRDSTTKYNPLGSGRLSDMEVKPFNYSPSGKPDPQTRKVYVTSSAGSFAFEFHTHEAANLWHKDFEAAIWACKKGRDRVRICIPVERLMSAQTTQYRHFINAKLRVMLDDQTGRRYSVTKTARANDRRSWNSTELEFGILRAQVGIVSEIEEAVAAANRLHSQNSIEKILYDTPSPIVEVEGSQEKEEALRLAATHDDPNGLAAKLVDMFTLRTLPSDLKIVKAHLYKTIPLAGTLAFAHRHLIFYRHRLPPFKDVRVKLPYSDLVGVQDAKSFRPHHYLVKLQIRGHPSMGFEFSNRKHRDLVLEAIQGILEKERAKEDNVTQEASEKPRQENGSQGADPIQTLLEPVSATTTTAIPHDTLSKMPKLVNLPSAVKVTIEPMRIICLTIGSRGDVQPYIALCKGLKEQGHRPCIVSHPEYQEWVEKHGIEFRGAGGDPGALMKLSVEHRLFSPAFFKESLGKFRTWLDELLRECYEQCWDAELLIESPSTMAGIHVAEAYQCYYFRAFTMPWTATRYLPQAFAVPPVDLGEAYNISSYALFDRVFWQATSGQINRWRRHMLGLAPTNFAELDQESVPFMYNFSSAVVPHPIDWSDNIAVTGYWFLSSSSEGWEAPEDLQKFIDDAKKDEKKIAYIGFGSITVPDAEKTTHNIYEAVKQADIRAIVSKGWSDRMSNKDSNKKPEQPPDCVYVVDSIPHDWLFPKIDIAFHHGGAGTTGASLRAGLVTLIKPWFGDQFFWSGRVQKLGAGLKVNSLDIDEIAEALSTAAADRIMVEKAADVGARIRAEDGVENAISFLNSRLSSAKRKYHPLKSKKDAQSQQAKGDNTVEAIKENADADSSDEDEEDMRAESEADQLKRDMSLLEKVRAIGNGGPSKSSRIKNQLKSPVGKSKSANANVDAIAEEEETSGKSPVNLVSRTGGVLTDEPAEMSREDEETEPASDEHHNGKDRASNGKRSSFTSLPNLPHLPGIPNPHLPTLTNVRLIDAFKAYVPGFDSDELDQCQKRNSEQDHRRSYSSGSDSGLGSDGGHANPTRKSTLSAKIPNPLKRRDSAKSSSKDRGESPAQGDKENDEKEQRRSYASAKEEDKRRRGLMEDKLKQRAEMLQEKQREVEGHGIEKERYRQEMALQRGP